MAAPDSAAALAAELAQALAVLAAAPEQVYYEPDADQAAAEAYYAGIPPAGYAELVTETHVRTPGYRPAVELYPRVDLQPDLTVRSLYTGQQRNPAELIRADMEVQQMRAAALTRLSWAPDADPDQAEAMVETVLPYNCEHVVPQSWFDRRRPIRGDLDHLFACEARCNSVRGNTAYTAYTEYADYPLPPAQAGPGRPARRAQGGA